MNLHTLAVVVCTAAISTFPQSTRAQSEPESPLPRAPRPVLAPVLVSVTAKNAPIEEVFTQLQKQAHVTFVAAAGAAKRVTLDLHDKPLWEVLKAALDQSPTAPLAAWKMDMLPDAVTRPLADYSGVLSARGPFLVIAGSASHEFNFQSSDEDAERVILQLQLLTDSSVAVITRPNWPRVLKASFENGDPLVDPNATSHDAPMFQSDVRGSFTLLLHPVKPSTIRHHALALVEGEAPADVAASTQTVELPLPGTLTISYLDQSVTLTAQPARPAVGNPRSAGPSEPTTASIGVEMKFPPANPPIPQAQQVHFSWAMQAIRATASDASSIVWTTQNVLATGGGPNGQRIGITMTAPPNTPLPKKITLHLPTAMVQIKIPFHFENIPLP